MDPDLRAVGASWRMNNIRILLSLLSNQVQENQDKNIKPGSWRGFWGNHFTRPRPWHHWPEKYFESSRSLMLTLIGTWAQANLRLKLKYQAGASQRSARVHGVLSIPCVEGVKRHPLTGHLNSFTLMWKIQVDDEAPNKMLSSALIPGGNLMLMRCFLKLNSSFFIWSQLLPCGLTPEPGSLISAARPPGTSSSSVSTLAFLDVPLLGVNITDKQGHTRFGQEKNHSAQ